MPMTIAEYQLSLNKLNEILIRAFKVDFIRDYYGTEHYGLIKENGQFSFPKGITALRAKEIVLEVKGIVMDQIKGVYNLKKKPEQYKEKYPGQYADLKSHLLSFCAIPGVFEDYFVDGEHVISEYSTIELPVVVGEDGTKKREFKALTEAEFNGIIYAYIKNRIDGMYSNPIFKGDESVASKLFSLRIGNNESFDTGKLHWQIKKLIQTYAHNEHFNAEINDILYAILKAPNPNVFNQLEMTQATNAASDDEKKLHAAEPKTFFLEKNVKRLQELVRNNPENKVEIKALAKCMDMFLQRFAKDTSLQVQIEKAKEELSALGESNVARYLLKHLDEKQAVTCIKNVLERSTFNSERIKAHKALLIDSLSKDNVSIVDVYIDIANAKQQMRAQRDSDKVKRIGPKGTLHQQIDEYSEILKDIQLGLEPVTAGKQNQLTPKQKEKMLYCLDIDAVRNILDIGAVDKFDFNEYCINFISGMMQLTRDEKGKLLITSDDNIEPIMKRNFGINIKGYVDIDRKDAMSNLDAAIDELRALNNKLGLFDSKSLKYQVGIVYNKLLELQTFLKDTEVYRATQTVTQISTSSSSSSPSPSSSSPS